MYTRSRSWVEMGPRPVLAPAAGLGACCGRGLRGLGALTDAQILDAVFNDVPPASSPACFSGNYGPLQPGQVFCATGTNTSPGILDYWDGATQPLQDGGGAPSAFNWKSLAWPVGLGLGALFLLKAMK